jgi:hypothetical protein
MPEAWRPEEGSQLGLAEKSLKLKKEERIPPMGTLRFLHLADVHLDTPFYGRDGQDEQWRRGRLRAATRTAFTRAVDLAIERRAHAVLVAGDFFDNDLLTFTTEQFILEQLGRLRVAGVRFFYATGNHDPGRANYRAHQLDWPDNVHIFRQGRAERVVVTDQASGRPVGWITGAGHLTAREENNLAAGFGAVRGDVSSGVPEVALLHAQIVSARGAEKHDRYAPATIEDLAAGRFDYWALGHVHVRQQVAPPLPAWYAGNIQGRNPRETGLKGGLWVEIEPGQPPVPEFISLAPLVWAAVTAECPPAAVTLDELIAVLAKQVEATLAGEAMHPSSERGEIDYLVRVTLAGRTPLVRELRDQENLDALARELEHRLGLAWVEVRPGPVTRPLDLAVLRQGPSVLATAVELIERAAEDDQLLDALAPGQLAADTVRWPCPHQCNIEPENRRRYLRELLPGLEAALAERLVPEKQE